MKLVALHGTAPEPWRNGGGSARTLLVWSPDAAAGAAAGAAPDAAPDDWALRISVADVTRDGPFSAYPGVERWFAVLRGAGVVLRFADRRALLDEHSAPLRFDGAEAPACTLQQGPTQDLNLMVRRGRASAQLLQAQRDVVWHSDAPLRGVYSTAAAVLHVAGAPALPLPADTLAWDDAAATQRWRLSGTGPVAEARAFWLHCTAHPR